MNLTAYFLCAQIAPCLCILGLNRRTSEWKKGLPPRSLSSEAEGLLDSYLPYVSDQTNFIESFPDLKSVDDYSFMTTEGKVMLENVERPNATSKLLKKTLQVALTLLGKDPYIRYWKLSDQILNYSHNRAIRTLADIITKFLPPNCLMQSLLSRKTNVSSDKKLIEVIEDVIESLKDNNLTTRERLWALGLLDVLQNKLKVGSSDRIIRSLNLHSSISRGELEHFMLQGE